MRLFSWLGAGMDVVLVYYFLVLNGGYLLLSFLAFREIFRHLMRSVYGGYEQIARSPLTPPISVIVPAHDEEVDIALAVNNLLHLDYLRYEVVVVNDGSTDRTLEELKTVFNLEECAERPEGRLSTKPLRAVYRSKKHHHLTVLDKENGGKADALNAGLNFARHPYFCAVDADVILESDALQRIVLPFVESPHRVVAAGGIVRVANGCRVEKGRVTAVGLSSNILAAFQVVEYARAFLCGRTGWSTFNALLIISGAFGLFERDLVVSMGGYRTDSLVEDMDLVVRLHAYMRESGRKDYRIQFVPDPVCWTQVPATLRGLSSQRRRWQCGLMEVLSRHSKLFLNPRYGAVGLLAYPFVAIFEGWGVLLEAFGYLLLVVSWAGGALQTDFAIAFLCASALCGTALSLSGIMLAEMTPRGYSKYSDWLALVLFAFLDNLGYRQLSALLRLGGVWDYWRGTGRWGPMVRLRQL